MGKWISKILALAVFMIAAANLFGFFSTQGDIHAFRTGRFQSPKLVIDTVRVEAGIVSIELREEFTGRLRRMRPSDGLSIFCVAGPMLADTSDSVHSYGSYYDHNKGLLYIKSSSDLDSGKVVVMVLIK